MKNNIQIPILALAAAFLMLNVSSGIAQESGKSTPKPTSNSSPLVKLAKPSAAQYAYHEQERIMFICLDPCTWQGREYDNHTTDLKTMKLPKLDVDQWCEAAKSWGAKELLFVAKHTGGFCWWQTETTDYSVKNIAWKNGKGDLVDEVAKACKRHGLKMGMYIYPGDDQWGANIGSGGRTKDPAKQEEYNKVLRKQWDEVLTRYKDVIIELWFDGHCYIKLGEVFDKHLGDSVVYLQGERANLRWVGNEKGFTPYPAWNTLMRKDLDTGISTTMHGNPDGDAWAGIECNTTLYDHHWFWAKEKESRRVSLNELLRFYYQSAGRGATTLLNSTPNTDGLIPEKDMALYKAFGKELKRRFSNPLGETSGKGTVFTIPFSKPTTVNQFQLMEDYRQGHRIRKYVVEGRKPDGQWVTLNEGSSVGRKRIVMFKPVKLTAVTLRITKHVNEPLVRNFRVYYVTGDNAHLYEKQKTKREVISLNAKASASDEHSNPYVAAKICDGTPDTWWGVSDRVKAPYTCWVELDLGSAKLVEQTSVNEPWNRIQSFRLEYRNRSSGRWKTAFKGTKVGAAYLKKFTPVSARYWRLHILKANQGPTIREWQLFGSDESSQWEICQRVESSAFKGDTADLNINLSKYIKQPGQFMIRMDDLDNAGVEIVEMNVFYDGNAVHEEVLSTVNKNEVYLLNRQAQVTNETKIELRLKLKRKLDKGNVNISIKSVF